jgi:hypothetical protein
MHIQLQTVYQKKTLPREKYLNHHQKLEMLGKVIENLSFHKYMIIGGAYPCSFSKHGLEHSYWQLLGFAMVVSKLGCGSEAE